MFVDDHEETQGAGANTLTVRLSKEEAWEILAGKVLTGKNENGGRVTVRVMVQDNPRPNLAS